MIAPLLPEFTPAEIWRQHELVLWLDIVDLLYKKVETIEQLQQELIEYNFEDLHRIVGGSDLFGTTRHEQLPFTFYAGKWTALPENFQLKYKVAYDCEGCKGIVIGTPLMSPSRLRFGPPSSNSVEFYCSKCKTYLALKSVREP